jgi:3-deoxy-D-manno-octulosonate 8-phosphate phosphatase KdsC-like HAD superfamily phosphatase
MHVRDGFSMNKALKEGIQILIITGGNSSGVIKKIEETLVILKFFIGVIDKLPVLKKYCEEK